MPNLPGKRCQLVYVFRVTNLWDTGTYCSKGTVGSDSHVLERSKHEGCFHCLRLSRNRQLRLNCKHPEKSTTTKTHNKLYLWQPLRKDISCSWRTARVVILAMSQRAQASCRHVYRCTDITHLLQFLYLSLLSHGLYLNLPSLVCYTKQIRNNWSSFTAQLVNFYRSISFDNPLILVHNIRL